MDKNYIEINRKLWNARTAIHFESDFYQVNEFIRGGNSLRPIELERLGNLTGKKVLHLQCHFGQDSISLARLGAEVTAVDLSDEAIERGRQLACDCNAKVRFICCDLYDLPNQLEDNFDLVFTSYGVIGWLPDLDKWASVISHFLKPGGRLLLVEFHPMVWIFDANFSRIQYDYFNRETIVETETGTYTDRDAPIELESVCWNHPTSEVLNSLIKNSLTIEAFDEFDYSPYNCFNKTVSCGKNQYRIEHLDNKIPMVFSVEAVKK
ncbi:class I SAM-dependent methyltransferase [Mangrovibacterium diazotrophicum]|uniref:Methyltransferase family protein n=1 Tax=Mangrovibacterium diazotrophicum TaxID=1261403 RepID=A0A419WB49_9BACT|nr:class I SAM-dependent methyltransferase [Mangrovibacterium diazotrophicum]RKD92677.1 methyltransferase family protein [Mangrovibacterium diazotrophicum]